METADAYEWKICLTHLLDPTVSEVAANGPESFFIKKSGKRIHLSEIKLPSEARYTEGVEAGLLPFTRALDAYEPNTALHEAPLYLKTENGVVRGRVHIALPPMADVPLVTIAKKSTSLTSLDVIASKGSMAVEMMEFLKASMKASLTIVFSGGTGAGKALHKDTTIPTPSGFRTVEELQVGDTIFDETGAPTKILRKYCPQDPKSFEITFKNGERVRASAGHFWPVRFLNEKVRFGYSKDALITDTNREALERLKASSSEGDLITRLELLKVLGAKSRSSSAYNFLASLPFVSGYDAHSLTREEIGVAIDDREGRPSKANRVTKAELEELLEENPHKKTFTFREINEALSYRFVAYSLKFPPLKDSYLNTLDAIEAIKEEHARREDRASKLSATDSTSIRPLRVVSTEEMLNYGVRNSKGRLNLSVDALSGPLQFEDADLPIDPYTLGAWLGDGTADREVIGSTDIEVRDRVSTAYKLSREVKHERREYQTRDLYSWTYDELRVLLRDNGLLKNKHIPSAYMTASYEQRKALLEGLVDTDGSVSLRKGGVSFGGSNERLVRDARSIALSLGWKCGDIGSKIPSYKDRDGNRIHGKRTYGFSFYPTEDFNLQVPHKKERFASRFEMQLKQQSRHERHYITSIEQVEDDPESYFCFEVDSPSHLFLCTDSLIPTHNTTMLEACTRLIPHQYRIGVAEDTPELTLEQPNVPYMHSYPWKPGMEEKDVATLDFVVSQVQRMRTDRIIVGETRGKEFASFLIAANSGMEGSLTTIHANSPRECLSKMTNFALRGSERQPVRSVNTDISTAIDLIIQLVILPDGRYKMASISEVTKGLSDKESADITISELYRYDHGKDIFIKGAQMSDALRRKLEVKGVDVAFFQTQRPGAVLHTPSEVPENEGPRVLPKTSERSGGLPRPGRRSGQ